MRALKGATTSQYRRKLRRAASSVSVTRVSVTSRPGSARSGHRHPGPAGLGERDRVDATPEPLGQAPRPSDAREHDLPPWLLRRDHEPAGQHRADERPVAASPREPAQKEEQPHDREVDEPDLQRRRQGALGRRVDLDLVPLGEVPRRHAPRRARS